MKSSAIILLILSLALHVHCGFHHVSNLEIRNKAEQGQRFVSLSEEGRPTWKSEGELMELKRKHTPFVDVTDVYDVWRKLPTIGSQSRLQRIQYPKPAFQDKLKPILTRVSITEMQRNMKHLTSFNNRWYLSATGLEASRWIFNTVNDIVDEYERDVSISLFNHTFPQQSIVARIPGEKEGPLTILGCHLDSVNLNDPLNGTAPGADDDGSGVVNLIEALRSLLDADFYPETPVEFHWYAGEEAGLRGSAEIATKYKTDGIEVQAMMQVDMSGYFKLGTEEVIALVPDYVDETLNEFVKSLITEYNRIPWAMEEPCNYGCSDHFSWTKVGYPTVYPFEAVTGDYNPQMHTPEDDTDLVGFSWEHSLEFAKLAVAFVYELSAARPNKVPGSESPQL